LASPWPAHPPSHPVSALRRGHSLWLRLSRRLEGSRALPDCVRSRVHAGTDDGLEWWKLPGNCSGTNMDVIAVDFRSKGGPELAGQWVVDDSSGKVMIVWPDGNSWGAPPPRWGEAP